MRELKFEAFEYQRARGAYGRTPQISIWKKGGRIGINSAFNRKFNPEKAGYVMLRYAEDANFIYVGLSLTKNQGLSALRIYYPKADFGTLQCLSFFKKYGLDKPAYVGSYPVFEVDDRIFGKMQVIKIKKEPE